MRPEAYIELESGEADIRLQVQSVQHGDVDGLLILDHDGKVLFANPRAHEMLLAGPGALEGRTFGLPLVPNYRAQIEIHGIDGAQTAEMTVCESVWLGQPVEIVTLRQQKPSARAAITQSYSALHDPLTGIGNRLLLAHYMERLARRRTPTAFLLIDLDRFKQVNDTLGHPAGDQLLREVAHRLVRVAPREAIVCRLGGDEFAVLLRGVRNVKRAEKVGRQILDALRLPVEIGGIPLALGASVGISLSSEHGRSFEEMMTVADRALYKSKSLGGHTVCVAETGHPAEREVAEAGAQILRHAMQAGQLELHFQPQHYLRRKAFVAGEALLRWNHPVRGLLTAGSFLSSAQDPGLMRLLDGYVFEQLGRQLNAWKRRRVPVRRVSVNVALPSLTDADLDRRILELMAYSEAAPGTIELEIPEGIRNVPDTVDGLRRLRRHPIRMVLDDFGAGNTALDWLDRLPIDAVKIDRALVATLGSDAMCATMVRAVLEQSRVRGLGVIAEGVETSHQFQTVKEMGCDAVQGYFVGRPMPATTFEQYAATVPGGRALVKLPIGYSCDRVRQAQRLRLYSSAPAQA